MHWVLILRDVFSEEKQSKEVIHNTKSGFILEFLKCDVL